MAEEHDMHMVPTQRAGEMGPWWTLGIKAVLICVVPWGSWVTVQTIKNQVFRHAGDRYTPLMANQEHARLMTPIEAKLDELLVQVTRLQVQVENLRETK